MHIRVGVMEDYLLFFGLKFEILRLVALLVASCNCLFGVYLLFPSCTLGSEISFGSIIQKEGC